MSRHDLCPHPLLLPVIDIFDRGDLVPLDKGDELYITYIGGKGTTAALNALLNFGFIPDELLR